MWLPPWMLPGWFKPIRPRVGSLYSLLPELGIAALTPQSSSAQGLWVCTDQVAAPWPSRRAGEGASHLL